MQRTRSRALRPVSVGALAVAVLAGCGRSGQEAVDDDGPGTRMTARPSPSLPTGPPLTPGWQRISSLGIEVDVPGDWQVDGWGCGAPPRAVVTRVQNAARMCARSGTPRFHLDFRPGGRPSPAVPRPGLGLSFQHPAHGSVATVRGEDGDLVRRIGATVRFVDVDAAGCATDRPDDPAWDRPAVGPGVTLPVPSSVSVCSYHGSVLAASALLTGDAAAAAVRSLTSAAPGSLPDEPVSSRTHSPPEATPLWLHVRDAKGAVTDVRIRYEGCRDRRVTTANGASHVTTAQLKALLGPLRTGFGVIGVPER